VGVRSRPLCRAVLVLPRLFRRLDLRHLQHRFLALRDPLRRFLALRRLIRLRALRRSPPRRLMSSTRKTTL